MADYFAEELVEEDVRVKWMLNPNRKSNRDFFAETRNEILNVIDVENWFYVALECKKTPRIQKIDKDVARMLQKDRKKVVGKVARANK